MIRRDAWGKGYTTEAARLVAAFAFEALGMHRLWAWVDVRNVASQRVLSKLGMTQEGTLREHQLIVERWRDVHVYAILEDDWRGRNP